MQTSIAVLQIGFAIVVPMVVLWWARRSKIVRAVSPVVICYVSGMLLGNQRWLPLDQDLALTMCGILVALAIPLLLFSVDIVAWARLALPTVLGLVFATVAVVISGTVGYLMFREILPEANKMAGMLAAVYTGGTPNMNAVGVVVGITPENFVMLNTTDMVLSFLYLTFLMSVAGRLWGRFLAPFPFQTAEAAQAAADDAAFEERWPAARELVPSIGLTLAIVAIAIGLQRILPASVQDAAAILAITTLALVASMSPRVRSLKGTQNLGQYLLLVFCVSIGATTDFSRLFTSSANIFLFDVVVLAGAVAIHLGLCALFRIDRDTTIITSTAAVFSPPFVPPVAIALKNREIIVSGIATGLVGYAIANYLGIGFSWLLARL